jgi:thiamine pyrophosphokinase
MSKVSTIILANGAFPKSQQLLDLLDAIEQIVCCDGAVNKLIESGREPSIIIGDLDSVSKKYKNQFQDILIPISDQNTNDLTKAINWCTAQGIDEVIIMGATGEREDHTIGNIALLTEYHKKIKVKILTDNGVFIPISKSTSFNCEPGQQISIFSLNPNIEITSTGLKYPLQKLALKAWWMGTLNETISNKFKIEFEGEAQLVVFILEKK